MTDPTAADPINQDDLPPGWLSRALRDAPPPVEGESDIEACRRIFGGREFRCRAENCQVTIQWLGVCDACARRMDDEVDPDQLLLDRMDSTGLPFSAIGHSWDSWNTFTENPSEDRKRINLEVAKLREWRGNPPLVILSGPSGTGKTHLASAVIRSCLWANGYTRIVRFWQEYEFLQAIKKSFNGGPDVMEEAMKADLLVLDDFGTVTKQSEWAYQAMTGFLAHRIDTARWTIVTTNLSHRDIAEMDTRLGSRMQAGQAFIINTRGAEDAREAMTPGVAWIRGFDR